MLKKPWNRVDLPVYSICSRAADGRWNMHIISYASQISMKPKRFICGIYEGTQTLSNVLDQPHFVLQLLSASQYRLVDLLGKKSGKYIDKMKKLEKRKLLTEWKGFPVLKDALAVMELQATAHFSGGDHEAFLCEVLSYSNLNEGDPLTLHILRKHKLIRI
jgi:flavin reductase (DIM6/NTAB) family NADH-FMN oxidoreductase RutF